jgi:hypothetical protein
MDFYGKDVVVKTENFRALPKNISAGEGGDAESEKGDVKNRRACQGPIRINY